MGNLAAILAHCQRGDEAILGDKAHTFLYEAGGISALGGVHSHQVRNLPDGTMNLNELNSAIRPDDAHFPVTRLISLENTHNRCGGVAVSVEYTQAVADVASENNLRLHLDGARLFNAATALGVSAKELAAPVDSLTFCLSKALCAPVGSVLCGERSFIQRAHRVRKQLGGGMRQAGILAAAGIVALENMPARLAEDHRRAQKLAAGLREIPGIVLDPGTPYTNMIFLSLSDQVELDASQVAQRLKNANVLAGTTGMRSFRLVTHYWIDDQAVDQAIEAFAAALETATG
jgi:threonine aldolase